MVRHKLITGWLAAALLLPAAGAHSQTAAAILERAANAMGGMAALRALRNETVESDGKQFDSSSTPQPLGPTRQISTFRYTLTRDLTQPRLRLEWDGRNSARNENIRFVEVIDGDIGLLREGEAKASRLHPGRLATRLREEKRTPLRILRTAAGQRSLHRRADSEVNGQRNFVLSFVDSNDEFHLYIAAKTNLPSQVDILEYDPLEGDSSYVLRYGDWRKSGTVILPYSLRLELNGKALQEEQIKSIQHNLTFVADPFSLPAEVRNEKSDAKAIASQWIMRRVAGNVSYLNFGKPPTVEWNRLADGLHKLQGVGHATIVVEMRDHLVIVKGPLYDDRTAPVVNSIKENFPANRFAM